MDDLESVIFHSHNGIISQNLLAELAERGIPLIVCNEKHIPVGVYFSLSKHHLTTARLAKQAGLGIPKRKQLWRQIIQCKILNQAKILSALGKPCEELKIMAKRVKSGDTENKEAHAAQIYWSRMFNEKFHRDPEQEGLNVFLNYGYAVLRATVVRSIVGCGLHPALALHHHNALDPTPLANDFMEPWRPVIDWAVQMLFLQGATELGVKEKKFLTEPLLWDMKSRLGNSPLNLCIQRMAESFVDICSDSREYLEIADLPNPNEFKPEKEYD